MSRALKTEIWVYRIVAIIVVFALVFFSNDTKAAGVFQSGNTLYQSCISEEATQKTFCIGYLQGSVDMMEGAQACTPGNMTGLQVKDIFTKYMRENPEFRDKRADHLMIVIFGTLYPCKKDAVPQARST